MISVKVTYTVDPTFVAQNKQNISSFLADFKKLKQYNFMYNVFLMDDGLTFLHVGMYEREEDQQQVLNVPSFLKFQEERDQSGLINQPKIEEMTLVGSSLNVI